MSNLTKNSIIETMSGLDDTKKLDPSKIRGHDKKSNIASKSRNIVRGDRPARHNILAIGNM